VSRVAGYGSIAISPDGRYYLLAAQGFDVPSPYRLRWLLPAILGPEPEAWRALTRCSYIVLPFAAWLYFVDLPWRERLFATALLCALPALRISWRLPVLTDLAAFVLALSVAASAKAGAWPVCAALSLILGAIRETGPVFAACWAWHPLPLLGLAFAGWWKRAANSNLAPWLAHPVREAWLVRRAVGFDASYVLPLGASLAGLYDCSVPSIAGTFLAAAQLFAAQDTARLLVWAGPALVAHAAQVIPLPWALCAVLLTACQKTPK
jgi:hypothetical protein